MNTRSAREYTIFAPAQFLRNWCRQRPSNRNDLDSSVTREVGRVYDTGVDLLMIFLYHSKQLLLGSFLYGTSCTSHPLSLTEERVLELFSNTAVRNHTKTNIHFVCWTNKDVFCFHSARACVHSG
jgi:hypothetical protein